MVYKSNLADYVNVEGISSSFNNNLRDFGNKLHNGSGDTLIKPLDKKLNKGILIIGTILTIVYAAFLGIGGIKARELEKEAIRATTIRREFNGGYELYSRALGIKFRHYENFADTFHDINYNELYIDFNHNGTVEIGMTPDYNIYKNKSPKTERLFHTLDNRIKEVKETLGVQ